MINFLMFKLLWQIYRINLIFSNKAFLHYLNLTKKRISAIKAPILFNITLILPQ